ncbi:MAG: DNA repair protein RadC [Gammaproteobacteria bacterium]|nr:DNA repair protein RadC [Gammaproteobacteria bacterium]
MSIRHWPIGERPRERLLHSGAQQLTDAELLAIFLRTGRPGVSAVDLARELLHEFGNLRELLTADQTRFCRIKGLGPAKFSSLQAVLEMGRRHLWQTLQQRDAITDPDHAKRYIHARLRDYGHEVFACLFLDTRHRVLQFEELFRGSLHGASVHPREVVKRALYHNAAALILAHNHPSGVAEPSAADRDLTTRLAAALGLVDVRVLDHLVVGESGCISFSERGWV